MSVGKSMGKCVVFFLALIGVFSCQRQKWTEQQADGYHLIVQKGGATLGYSPSSGIKIGNYIPIYTIVIIFMVK